MVRFYCIDINKYRDESIFEECLQLICEEKIKNMYLKMMRNVPCGYINSIYSLPGI